MKEDELSRLNDVDIVKDILGKGRRAFEIEDFSCRRVATPSLSSLLQDWLKEHDVEDHEDDGESDDGSQLDNSPTRRELVAEKNQTSIGHFDLPTHGLSS